MLAQAAAPDPAFAKDIQAVRDSVGPAPGDPSARSQTQRSSSSSSEPRASARRQTR